MERTVTLGETFYRALQAHAVPLWEPAIRAIANQSMTLDVYVWLAYRLRAVAKPTLVPWPALYAQFGAGFGQLRQCKPRFLSSVRTALAVYEDAKVDQDDQGLILRPSYPPVRETKAVLLPRQRRG